jgi:hypothetical protein
MVTKVVRRWLHGVMSHYLDLRTHHGGMHDMNILHF